MPKRYMKFFRLVGREVEEIKGDVVDWAKEFENMDRHVCDTFVGSVRVSTIFLSLNHGFDPDGPPVLFETMVFGGPMDREMDRYSTFDEAVAGHNNTVDKVKEAAAVIERFTRKPLIEGDSE